MIKRFYLFVLYALLNVIGLHGQQIGLFSQYMLNDFAINPAIAGIKEYIPIQLNYRNQWVGIKNAPVIEQLFTHGYLDKGIGMGAIVFNQIAGPTRRTGFNLSIAYHIPFEEKRTLSFGLAPVLYQYVLNKEKLYPENPNDPSIINSFNNQFVPDANWGVNYSNGNIYYVGFSIYNLMQSKSDLFETTGLNDNFLNRTYYLTGGYNYFLEDFMLQPGLLVQYTERAPMQIDLSTRLFYKQKVWLGFSYRNQDAVVAYMGLKMNMFLIGYSYDITLSDIKEYSSGTHEIIVALKLPTGETINRRGGFNSRKFKPSMKDF